jgi:hypothetical protein
MIILVFHGQLGEVCPFYEKNGHISIACHRSECATRLQNKKQAVPFSVL